MKCRHDFLAWHRAHLHALWALVCSLAGRRHLAHRISRIQQGDATLVHGRSLSSPKLHPPLAVQGYAPCAISESPSWFESSSSGAVSTKRSALKDPESIDSRNPQTAVCGPLVKRPQACQNLAESVRTHMRFNCKGTCKELAKASGPIELLLCRMPFCNPWG